MCLKFLPKVTKSCSLSIRCSISIIILIKNKYHVLMMIRTCKYFFSFILNHLLTFLRENVILEVKQSLIARIEKNYNCDLSLNGCQMANRYIKMCLPCSSRISFSHVSFLKFVSTVTNKHVGNTATKHRGSFI